MFGKLFGRGKAKRDQLGLELSSVSVPGSDATPASGIETTVTTTTSEVPMWPGTDLQSILATVKEVQAQSGGDHAAMARLLQERFGHADVTIDQASMSDWTATGAQDPIALLATLTELHEKGVVTDEQFEEQKRRLLGSG